MREKKPCIADLRDSSLLGLAAKKAFKFVQRHQWYHDRTNPISFMSRLNLNIWDLSQSIGIGGYESGRKIVFAAPKRIDIIDGKEQFTYRPLCIQPFKDEVVEVALLCLYANLFDPLWGDIEKDKFPSLLSYGNRLHLVSLDNQKLFSVGNSKIYRDWPDDYAKFVRETERFFNTTLTKLRQGEMVVLLCTDIKAFYTSINRSQIANMLKKISKRDLWNIIDIVFGEYTIERCLGFSQEDFNLHRSGLAQGPAHSGFWANVYLTEFDNWVVKSLARSLNKTGLICSVEFYARYVDDIRIIMRCKRNDSVNIVRQTTGVISNQLQKLGLYLSMEKTSEISQDSTGSLLTTGQIAERMQSLSKRAYFPLPPENLEEMVKEIRLLFHAETNIHSQKSKDFEQPEVLDNPGVRADSRRRFAVNKWVRIARDLERMSTGWLDRNKDFAQEIIRIWHEDPGQTKLLERALEIGLTTSDTSKVIKRLKLLKEDETSFGYYAFIIAYLLDAVSWAGLKLKGWPLKELAREVVKKGWNHRILINKCQQYFLQNSKRILKSDIMLYENTKDNYLGIRLQIEGERIEKKLSEREISDILCSLRMSSDRLLKSVEAILKNSNIYERKKLLRSLLPKYEKLSQQLAQIFDTDFFELKAYNTMAGENKYENERKILYQRILNGEFKGPIKWVELGYKLMRFVRSKENEKFIARGLFNPFTLWENEEGEMEIIFPDRVMATYIGYYPQRKNSIIKNNTSRWCLPLGIILQAAATGNPKHLLGFGSSQRLGLPSSFGLLTRYEAKLPKQAGGILDRLLAWHGSQIKGYMSIRGVVNDFKKLHTKLKSNSVNEISICDIDLPLSGSQTGSPFNLILCQIPSFPGEIDEATVRRSLLMTQLLLQQKGRDGKTVDLVVFPELSVPISSIGALCKFASRTKTIVLAGLELHVSPRRMCSLNELMWIVPLDEDSTQIAILRQDKIHVTGAERNFTPPVIEADPAIIWRIISGKGRLAAINCYEFTDLVLRDLLRGRVEALVVAANNQDVTTFDNLVESTQYDLFSHVILVNAERFGGSAVRAPYMNLWDRRIFDIHGQNLFSVNVCSLNLLDFRNVGGRPRKSPPAGFQVYP